MTPVEYEDLVFEAREKAKERMARARESFGLGTYPKYEIDLKTAEIRFLGEDGAAKVRARIVASGSWSAASASWMWAWENSSIPAQAREGMEAVQTFGREHVLPSLQESFAPCDEAEAWSMASVAAQLLDAECIYRTPRTKSHLFLLLFSIQRI